jgi:mono/diheme cytochrome c family protein
MSGRAAVRRHRVWALAVMGLLGGAFTAGARQSPTPASPAPARPARGARAAGAVAVTPVTGSSTLHHLGLSIEHSSMGWEGQWGEQPATVPQPPTDRTKRLEDPATGFPLNGADLYRVSCRACHKANGAGSPPEINSLIGPVQAASVQWMTQRMKERGRTVSPSFMLKLTAGNEADLQKRLKVGGHSMPSFAHLSAEEIVVLRPYLDQMAGVPGAERQQREMTEPAVRVGELIVKGTCHICHDATGPDDKPTTVLGDVIPALGRMTHQKTQEQFVQKVCAGSPIPLSAGGVMSRGRMPVFNYLTAAEAASAYSYLVAYPPK